MSKALCWKCSRFVAMAFVMICVSLVSVSVSHAGLIDYYEFNDSSDAASALDRSGNGYDGVVVGAVYGGAGSGVTGDAGDQ